LTGNFRDTDVAFVATKRGEGKFAAMVKADLRAMRPEMHPLAPLLSKLMRTAYLRSLADIVFDWAVIGATLLVTLRWSWWLLPPCLLVIGNRQRALGNTLHDASHRNLSRNAFFNDATARLLVAPMLFNSFALYRSAHMQHHAYLGDPQRDPDYMAVPKSGPGVWRRTVLTQACSPRKWCTSVFGDLIKPIDLGSRCYIISWWLFLIAFVAWFGGMRLSLAGAGLWLLARATSYHLITVFREMCDHFGRTKGGIFDASRDLTASSPLAWLIHPRHDGYHLTHHLLPSVPYSRLPRAHRLLRRTALFCQRALVCDSYFLGARAVVCTYEGGGTQR
jgi:fatty acid desaturase